MSDVWFRGISLTSLGSVYISQMPSHKKASMRYSEYYVHGRDGALHVDEGLSNFDLHLRVVLVNGGADLRQLVNAWADGTGKLITSDDLRLAYNASVKEEVSWSRLAAHQFVAGFVTTKQYAVGDFCKYDGQVYKCTTSHTGEWDARDFEEPNYLVRGLFDTADITFDCQPYMVEAVDSQIVLTESSVIQNPGSAEAFPLIEVNGSGDVEFSVNGTNVQIADMTENVPVYLDCDTGYVYTADGATTMTGNFPVLGMGTNSITLASGVDSLRITPHWRWI